MIAVSIISHGHGEMVLRLLGQVLRSEKVSKVIVTLNVPESFLFPRDNRVVVRENVRPKGFGANHNAAFECCSEPYFCALNPDVEFIGDPFPSLLAALESASAAVVAPRVMSPSGRQEDSIRRFPSFCSLVLKGIGAADGRYVSCGEETEFFPDWVAGMFMLFRSDAYARLEGFDERFFLYYEDVDICSRVWLRGMKVLAYPQVTVVHDARRDSRRSFRYMRWHLASMFRYFMKYRRGVQRVER